MHPTPLGPLGDCLRDWEELQQDFQSIQETHRLYRLKLEELTKLQNNCTSSITRQKKQLQELTLILKKCKSSLPVGAEETAQELENQMKERQGLFFDMEAYLPKKNGLYLSLVLGNVNVTLLSKQAKVTDAAFNFLLVWYYCTLTIRESILINNGSRIKGWWVFHHYVSTFLSGVMLTWPDGLMYQKFRNQFLSFSMYQSFVQFLQYYYQSGCLYRLRALGERHTMDLTVEGFQSWMWRGLTFLLPFLFFGHFWQLFNALTLFSLARDPECKEWQVSWRPWEGRGEGRCLASGLNLIPPPGAHVRPPFPHPLPWQFLHHPTSRAPEIPQSATQEQERMRLGLPLPSAWKGLLYPMCCLRGCMLPSSRRVSSALPWFCGLCGPRRLCWRRRPGPVSQPAGIWGQWPQ
uniref:Transmembrane protein 120A n=1 Tax=Rhinolophus ferrumequinum TaxID=59479 RepID=A0A671EGJ8_RHIFE